MFKGKNTRSKIKESGTLKWRKTTQESWVESNSSIFTLHILRVPKSFQRLLQWITVKTLTLEHLIQTEITTLLQSWVKVQEKSHISFLVKCKQFLVDQKELAHMTFSVGKLEPQLQSTQIRVTKIYYLQKFLAFKGI